MCKAHFTTYHGCISLMECISCSICALTILTHMTALLLHAAFLIMNTISKRCYFLQQVLEKRASKKNIDNISNRYALPPPPFFFNQSIN